MKSAEVKPATGAKSGPGKPFFTGAGGAVQEKEGRAAFFSTGGGGRKGIQAKLTVGAPEDKYERQADATADKVVMRLGENRAPESRAPEKRGPAKPMAPGVAPEKQNVVPPVQMKCAKCAMEERKMKEEEKEAPKEQKVQRKPIFDSNAEPPPGDSGAAPPGDHKKIIQCCAACEGKDMVQRSGVGPAPAGGDLESRLNSSKGGGQPLPEGTRQQMESSMGADFSGVRVHNDTGAAQMNKDLSAHAFTHGNDIYFNSGKYNPDSKEGQHLLAHELTHTVQQGAAPGKQTETAPGMQTQVKTPRVQRGIISSLEDAVDWVGSGISDLAGDAYDLAGDIAGGIKDLAVDIGEGISDIASSIAAGFKKVANWVGDKLDDLADMVKEGLAKVAEFIQFLIDQIKAVILKIWSAIQAAVDGAIDALGEAFKELIRFFTTPLYAIGEALEEIDGEAVERGWLHFVDFVDFWWKAWKMTGQDALDLVSGMWNGLSGIVDGFFNKVEGIMNGTAFSYLPDVVQSVARKAVQAFRAFWETIKSGWNFVWNKIDSAVHTLFRWGDEFMEGLRGVPVAKIVGYINKFGTLIKKVVEIINNPHLLTDPIINWIADKLKNAPDEFLAEIDSRIAVERAKKKKAHQGKMPARYSLNDFDISMGVVRACLQKWKQVDLVQMLKDSLLSMFWPPATAAAIWKAWLDMLTGIKGKVKALFSFSSLQELWTNILHLADIVLIIGQFLNTVAGLLYGYIAILLIIGGGVLGAVFGAGAGVVPGIMLGLEGAGDLGGGMLTLFLGVEGGRVGVQYLLLSTGLLKEEEQEESFNTLADSIIGLVVLGLLALMFGFAARIAEGVMAAARKIFSKLGDLLKDTGDAVKGKPGEHAGVPEDKAGTGDKAADKGSDKAGDEGGDKAAEDASDIDPNKVEKGEVELEKPLEGSEDGQRKMAMDKDGECEVCASPCDKLRKKYGNYIDKKLGDLIDAIQKKKISNKAKLRQLKPIEQKLRKKLTHLDSEGNLKAGQKDFKMAGEFNYFGESDKLGRLKRVHTNDLKLSEYDRIPHEGDTPGKLKRDQAGHLFGDRFGGSPELDNLVSQNGRKVNLSKFKTLENRWAAALSGDPPKKVKVDIKVNYEGKGVRPTSFDVEFTIEGEPTETFEIEN